MQALFSWLWRLVPGNPQVLRIIHGASRRNRHAWMRVCYVAGMVGFLFYFLTAFGGLTSSGDLDDLAQAGSLSVYGIASWQLRLLVILAPIYMAGAIASEQSGKTYAILLTTPLSNLQIVLGSLLGRLFFIIALICSTLPLFAIMLIFGGVPFESIFIAFAIAILTALFVGSVAVMLSVLRAGGRKAVFAFVVSILTFLAIVQIVDEFFLKPMSPGQTTALTPLHPNLVLSSVVFRANYSPPDAGQLAGYPWPVRFYLGQPLAAFATITAGSSLLIILFCSLWVRRIGAGDSKLMIWLKGKFNLTGARTRAARSLGTGNPVAWREANTRGRLLGPILARYSFLAIGLVAVGILLYFYHFDPFWQSNQLASVGPSAPVNSPPIWFRKVLAAILITEVAIITLVALYMSAGSVSNEREDGTLDIMLTTPITPRYYIWGKLRGLVRFLSMMIALPVLTLATVAVYTIIGNILRWPQTTVKQETFANNARLLDNPPLIYFETPVLMLIMLVPFIAVCVAVGMYASLRAKSVIGAIVPSLAIIGIGAMISALCGILAAGGIPLIGPILNAFSPATNIFMLTDPHEYVAQFSDGKGSIVGRIGLGFAAIAAAAGYASIVWAFITTMVKGFDHTVRRLSGTK